MLSRDARTGGDIALRLVNRFGGDRVVTDRATRALYASDSTENEPHTPRAIVYPKSVDEIRALLEIAREARCPVTSRVAGLNVGGLAIPAEGGIVCDLSRMNRILDVNRSEQYALVEPGVTWGDLKERLAAAGDEFVVNYPLAPPETSVLACCLMDGLGTLTMRYGSMGEWVNGVEAVLADGTVVRTGAASVSPVWFSRGPLPDLTGLFINFQGTTGIVTKLALQLWPKRRLRERVIVPAYEWAGAFEFSRRIARTGLFDECGGFSWPAAKMLFGVAVPAERDPAEPAIFFAVDVSADTHAELALKRAILADTIRGVRALGFHFDAPLDVNALIAASPGFSQFSDLPTRLTFLIDNPGGGLTWIGAYGPMSTMEEAARDGFCVMARHGFPPLLVTRPMKGGHYAVMRFVETFRRADPADVARIRALHAELVEVVLDAGYIPYKLPPSLVPAVMRRMDPGARDLLQRVKAAVDAQHILNPGKLGF